jgi:cytochrome b subunit of formate dehydrogenase
MNKPVVFLRTASVLTLVHAVLHTVGGVFGSMPPGPATVAAAAMKANQFVFMGSMRSYWEFHRGMGLMVTVFLTAEGILMWQLALLARTDARRLRPVMATLLVAYLALAAISCMYFFIAPIVVEGLIAACIGVAFATAKETAA